MKNLDTSVLDKIRSGDFQEFLDALGMRHPKFPDNPLNEISFYNGDLEVQKETLRGVLTELQAELLKGDASRIKFVAPESDTIAPMLDTSEYATKYQETLPSPEPNLLGSVTELHSSELVQVIDVAKQYWLGAGANLQTLDYIQFSIDNLATHQDIDQNAIAITQGNSITIDSTANGYGWFVDATPNLNEEYTADANGYSYTSLAGNDSKSKIDLLTVLIHEMGNVLGIGHKTTDDVMSLVLEAGKRRLPNAADAAFLNLLSSGTLANTIPTVTPTRSWTAPTVNSSLLDPDFSSSDLQGWMNQGDIRVNGSGSVQLNETTSSQTHLAQAFQVGANNHVLSFTIADGTLQAVNKGPNDAFEVALLDAATGLPITAVTDLNHTDALLNIQSNGSEHIAAGVHKVSNGDGSATYFIDLPQALVDSAVMLSFDLLGFGAADSHVTIRDIHLVSDPVANEDIIHLDEDMPATGNVLSNDIQVGAAWARVQLLTPAQHGTVTLANDGTFNYLPDANYNGADSFSYQAIDTEGRVSNPITVSLIIRSVDDAPIVPNQTIEVIAGKPFAFDPLQGATDVEGDTMQAQFSAQPEHGTLVANADGTYTYIADTSFVGTDSFSYVVSDGTIVSNPVVVTFNVLPANTAPVATSQQLTVLEDQQLIIPLSTLGHDDENDTLTVEFITQPAHGVLSFNADGSVVYTPTADFNGVDQFSYRLNDGKLYSADAVLTINVTPVNDAPVLQGQNLTTAEDNTITINPLTTASDVDGDTLTAAIVAGPAHGTLTVNADGSFSYIGAANYNGTDSFTYRVNDGHLDSGIATVNLTITPVNDAPVAADVTLTTAEDTVLIIDFAAYGVDVDNPTLTPVIIANPAHGTLTQLSDGRYSYLPAADYNGVDLIRFAFSDGELQSNVASLTLNVTPVNDAPVLQDQNLTTAEDNAITINPLTTASDVDGDTLTAAIVAGPAHGTLTVNADGSFSYIGAANYNGTDSFTYRVNDGQLDSRVATVNLTITPVNDAPVAADVTLTTAEDTALIIDFAAYGVDVDNPTLTPVIIANPAHGTLTQLSDGRYSYLPAADYNGVDLIRFAFSDGELQSNVASLTLNVTPVNDAPVLQDQNLTTAEDTAITINPLATASDVDGDALTDAIVAGPAHGTLTVNADGSFKYLCNKDYNGSDSFTYKVNDGQLDSGIATVNLTVTPVNDAPVAADTSVTTAEDTVIIIDFKLYGGDVDSPMLTPVIIGNPAHGTLTQLADGRYSYLPSSNYNGMDTIRFALNDGELQSNVASLNLTITPVNDAPVLQGQTLTTAEDTPLTINPLATASDVENDPLTAAIVAGPAHGALTINANGSFTYRPVLNYNGSDSFTYKMNDGQLDSGIATVNLTVTPVNDAPVAADTSVTTAEDTAIIIDFKLYGSDVDSPVLTPVIIGNPAHGTLTQLADGRYRYLPSSNYNGTDTIRFALSDGELQSNVASLNLTITPVNDAPVLQGQTLTTAEDTPLTINPLATASDVENDPLTAAVVAGPTHGTLTVNADGSFKYLGNKDYNGSDSFTYRVNDGQLNSNIATVNLTITPVNDAPVLQSQTLTTLEDTAITINPLATASDVDGDVLTASIVAGPAHGTLTVNADGSWKYLGNKDYNGTDSFTYRVNDGQLNSTIATVNLTITPVNDAPVAIDASVTTAEDNSLILNLRTYGSDVDSPVLTPVIIANPAHGTLTLLSDGRYSYLPSVNYNGSDSLRFALSDGQLQSNTATLFINITPVNDAPALLSQNLIVAEDTALTINPLATASDVDGDALIAAIVTGPVHGTLTVKADGSFSYLGAKDFNGTDSFTYRVNDGQLNSAVAIVNLTITPVNDAPVAFSAPTITAEDTPLVINLGLYGMDVDNPTLTPVIISNPAHGTLTLLANGYYSYRPAANYNGNDSLTFAMSDGQLLSNVATLNIVITSVDDAPVALNSSVSGVEDTAVLLKWSDFVVSDVENDPLSIRITTLPVDGVLQRLVSGQWVAVAVNTVFTQAAIQAGSLRFVPAANASGGIGYVHSGYGNRKQHYASFGYVANDGTLDSTPATITVDIAAVADTPTLSLNSSNLTQELFRTGWESATNLNNTSTLVAQSSLEGWSLVTDTCELLGGNNGFEIWSAGDKMADNRGITHSVAAKAGNGNNWLELNDAGLGQSQTLGIQRQVQTQLGASYTLSFDYAGRIGYSAAYTNIAVYVDGVKLASYSNTSPSTALDWKSLSFNFTGTGKAQTIRIVTDSNLKDLAGRGAMIDNVALNETRYVNHGSEDSSIRLNSVQAGVTDTDGSESLVLTLDALPVGAVVSDGVYTFISTDAQRVVDISLWNLSTLALTPPSNFSGKMSLQVIATSIEVANGSRASTVRNFDVVVTAVADAPTLNFSARDSISRELVSTSWESAINSNTRATVVYGSKFEGWNLVCPQLLKLSGFEVLSQNDKISNATGQTVTVQGSGHGSNWLHLNDGANRTYQTLGVEKNVSTINGGVYTLQLDYAGDLGLLADKTQIGIYVDDQLIKTYANTSSNTALSWQALSFQFAGNGQSRKIRIQLEGGTGVLGRGAMINLVRVVETLPAQGDIVYGFVNQPIALPKLDAHLTDTDGSELLTLSIKGIPCGSVISDGSHTFTASGDNAVLSLAGWNISNLSYKAPLHNYCDIQLQIVATSTEQSNGQSASTIRTLTIKQLTGTQVATPATVSPYVTSTQTSATTPTQISVSGVTTVLPSSTVGLIVNPITPWEQEEYAEQQKALALTTDWLRQLELNAQQNWSQFIGGL